jgi:hypothetical protein
MSRFIDELMRGFPDKFIDYAREHGYYPVLTDPIFYGGIEGGS